LYLARGLQAHAGDHRQQIHKSVNAWAGPIHDDRQWATRNLLVWQVYLTYEKTMSRLDFGVAWEEDIVGTGGLGHQARDEEE
jgi:hypothetical protein